MMVQKREGISSRRRWELLQDRNKALNGLRGIMRFWKATDPEGSHKEEIRRFKDAIVMLETMDIWPVSGAN